MNRSHSRQRCRKTRTGANKSHRVRHILLLVETSSAYGRGVVEGIAQYARENSPWSIQFENRALDSLPPKWLKEWRGDGILSRTVNLKMAKLLWATKLPMVELHGNPQIGASQLRNDHLMGSRMVVDHFWNAGLRQFAYFSYSDAWGTKWHRETFLDAVKERGCGCRVYKSQAAEQNLPVWHESQRPQMIEWLRSLPRPIGIYAAGDLHAVRLMDICREIGIAVPEELAIMGCGNDPVICGTVRPTLSSLDLNAQCAGYEAAKLLDRKMAGKSSKDMICIPPSHVAVRQSTDLMVIDDPDVVQAMHFIRNFACSGIDVPRVAEEVALSTSVLERRFHKHLGRTPMAEIMRTRIERAKMLLAQTDKSSGSIAQNCGFRTLAYFTNVFRQRVGMTPNAYRRMRRISRDLKATGEPE
jgi:LacI family transcriptional regulator